VKLLDVGPCDDDLARHDGLEGEGLAIGLFEGSGQALAVDEDEQIGLLRSLGAESGDGKHESDQYKKTEADGESPEEVRFLATGSLDDSARKKRRR